MARRPYRGVNHDAYKPRGGSNGTLQVDEAAINCGHFLVFSDTVRIKANAVLKVPPELNPDQEKLPTRVGTEYFWRITGYSPLYPFGGSAGPAIQHNGHTYRS